MSNTKDTTGGPAFPFPSDCASGEAGELGMTLRDYFAAKAMATLLQGAVLPTKADRDEWLPKLAEISYEMADAMLREKVREL